MQYLGGKKAIAKPIIDLLLSLRSERDFLEPFCGGLWITAGISEGTRHASDVSQPLITLYQALQRGWVPPDSLSESEYYRLKDKKDPADPLTAFAGFGCSHSGKYFRGYARGAETRNYALGAKRSLLKKFKTCQGVVFTCCDYRSWNPENKLIYCDPPYAGTTMYPGTGDWDATNFWKTMAEWSRPSNNNVVVISEYVAPENFESILEISTRTSLRSKIDGEPRSENVFRLKK